MSIRFGTKKIWQGRGFHVYIRIGTRIHMLTICFSAFSADIH